MAKNGRCPAGQYYCYTNKECKPIPKGFMVDPEGMLRKENGASVDESKSGDSSLRDWFSKSKSSDGKPGWVQLGGKYAGKPCARQPGQTTKPKCGSSKMKRNLSKDEEEAAFRRKNRKDPNPDRKGKAINVKTEGTIHEGDYWHPDPKKDRQYGGEAKARHREDRAQNSSSSSAKKNDSKKLRPGESYMDYAKRQKGYNAPAKPKKKGILNRLGLRKEEFTELPLNLEVPTDIRDFNLGLMFRESLEYDSGMLFIFDEAAKQSFYMKETKIPLDIAFISEEGIIESIKELEPYDETPISSEGDVICAIEANRGWFEENYIEVGDEIEIEEGKKDACYHKVKARYSVWPSAYASGALVKCRKKGAANWGNKTKKESFEFGNWKDNYVPTEYESIDIIKPEPLKPTPSIIDEAGKKCWKGYKKAGTQKLFGKTYNRCVKAGDEVVHDGEQINEKKGCAHNHKGEECPVHGMKECPANVEEAVRLKAETGNVIFAMVNWKGKYLSIKMFFPQAKRPSRKDVQAQVEKVYPGGKVTYFQIAEVKPGEQLLRTMEEDWQSVNRKDKTDGLSQKAVNAYRRENPGSKLKTAVTTKPSKLKAGSKDANRRKSFCSRMKGMKKRLTSAKTARDPDSRINKALRRWNCN
tara:strand:- start:206 stop:2125 length:1920 start_codon:yes stop_codon:yes gene_type:complete